MSRFDRFTRWAAPAVVALALLAYAAHAGGGLLPWARRWGAVLLGWGIILAITVGAARYATRAWRAAPADPSPTARAGRRFELAWWGAVALQFPVLLTGIAVRGREGYWAGRAVSLWLFAAAFALLLLWGLRTPTAERDARRLRLALGVAGATGAAALALAPLAPAAEYAALTVVAAAALATMRVVRPRPHTARTTPDGA